VPYVSRAQQDWAHTPEGEKALGGPSKVAEWDEASKGQTNLPEHVATDHPLHKLRAKPRRM